MKNNKRAHNYKRTRLTNPYTWIFLMTIFCIWLMAGSQSYDDVYVKEAEPVLVITEESEQPKPVTVEDKIKFYFPRNWKTMIAVAKAESGMRMESKGWNCFYSEGKATTTPIKGGSKACKVEDRAKAYSVDCFVLQKNYKGQKCPQGVTLDQHLEEVANLSRVQGLEAWSAYNNKSYKAHLAKN